MPQAENRSRVPFDDRAALEELERLQRSIQEYRRRREEAEGAFEQFVGSFRAPVAREAEPVRVPAVAEAARFVAPKPAGVPATGLDAFESADSAPRVPVASSAVVVPPAPVAPPPAPTPEPARPAFFDSPVAAPAAADLENQSIGTEEPHGGRRAGRGRVPLVIGGVAMLVVAAVLMTRPRNDPGGASQAAPSPVQTPVTPPVAAAPAAAAPAPAPVPPAEIRTVRRVWVRAVVDGNREVERELEADVVVPLPAGRTYVIRAGDAGAVRLLLNGQDQGPLGREGVVATRTFTVPAAPVTPGQ
jgi:hypothetical protein